MQFLDDVTLNFSPQGIFTLKITLGLIMYGIALDLRIDDFKRVFSNPASPLIGLISQFILLPALTFVLVSIIDPIPSIALGMILVGVCPGGNISNFISVLAKANVALSVSLTAISTSLATFATPLNFAFWAGLYMSGKEVSNIELDVLSMMLDILLMLGLPMLLGMFTAHKYPKVAKKLKKPMRILSILIFGAYVLIALIVNFDAFINYVKYIFLIVVGHNALAFLLGFIVAKVTRRNLTDTKTITIETGIQNSGLAMVLVFDPRFFEGLGGMAIIAAFWGVWHLVSGMTLATLWARFTKAKPPLEA